MLKVNLQVSGLREFLMANRKTLVYAAFVFGAILLHVAVVSLLSLLGIERSAYAGAFHQYCAIYATVQAIALDAFAVRMLFMSGQGQFKMSLN